MGGVAPLAAGGGGAPEPLEQALLDALELSHLVLQDSLPLPAELELGSQLAQEQQLLLLLGVRLEGQLEVGGLEGQRAGAGPGLGVLPSHEINSWVWACGEGCRLDYNLLIAFQHGQG